VLAGEDRWLKYPVTHDDLEGSESSRDTLPGYAFVPDGKHLLNSIGGKIWSTYRTASLRHFYQPICSPFNTYHRAEAIGLAQDLGSIEPGKLADLVVLKKNPLEEIRNTITTRFVMKTGELFHAGTLDELWPEKKVLPAMWQNYRPRAGACEYASLSVSDDAETLSQSPSISS
jgi:hypothetical protein